MRRAVWILVGLLGAATSAQQPNPTFDVTSVKRSNAKPDDPSPFQLAAGRFVTRKARVRTVIEFLYLGDDGRVADRVVGGPNWIDTDEYDLEGKTVEGNPPEATLRAMARSLLEDRFQLRIRREVQQGPVYELVVASGEGKLGRQLKPSNGDDCTTDPRASFIKKVPVCGLGLPMSASEIGVSGYHLTMEQIAQHMRVITGRPVINRTGLDGKFSFSVTVPRQVEALSGPVGGAADPLGWRALVPDAVREQLGLRLANATGPVDVLVIDSIQRPTEN